MERMLEAHGAETLLERLEQLENCLKLMLGGDHGDGAPAQQGIHAGTEAGDYYTLEDEETRASEEIEEAIEVARRLERAEDLLMNVLNRHGSGQPRHPANEAAG